MTARGTLGRQKEQGRPAHLVIPPNLVTPPVCDRVVLSGCYIVNAADL